MNWYFVLELLAHIAVCQVIYLPLTVYLWRDREMNGCETFHATALPEYQIHLDQTQALPTTKSSPTGIFTSCVLTLLRFRRLTRFFTAS
jgi:hypothetical protein